MTVSETVDAFHFGKFYIVQPKGRGHRAGMDAMLLAALVAGKGPMRVADLGAGAGAAGMGVASRIEGAEVVLFERSAEMADYARKSIAHPDNARIAPRLSLIEADATLKGKARLAAPRIIGFKTVLAGLGPVVGAVVGAGETGDGGTAGEGSRRLDCEHDGFGAGIYKSDPIDARKS